MRGSALLSLAVLILAQGCAHQMISRRSVVPAGGDVFVENYKTVIFGIENVSDAIDLSKVCSTHWKSVRTYVTWKQALLKVVTLNIYSPWTAEVDCEKPKPKETTDPF